MELRNHGGVLEGENGLHEGLQVISRANLTAKLMGGGCSTVVCWIGGGQYIRQVANLRSGGYVDGFGPLQRFQDPSACVVRRSREGELFFVHWAGETPEEEDCEGQRSSEG